MEDDVDEKDFFEVFSLPEEELRNYISTFCFCDDDPPTLLPVSIHSVSFDIVA